MPWARPVTLQLCFAVLPTTALMLPLCTAYSPQVPVCRDQGPAHCEACLGAGLCKGQAAGKWAGSGWAWTIEPRFQPGDWEQSCCNPRSIKSTKQPASDPSHPAIHSPRSCPCASRCTCGGRRQPSRQRRACLLGCACTCTGRASSRSHLASCCCTRVSAAWQGCIHARGWYASAASLPLACSASLLIPSLACELR